MMHIILHACTRNTMSERKDRLDFYPSIYSSALNTSNFKGQFVAEIFLHFRTIKWGNLYPQIIVTVFHFAAGE